MSIRSRTLADFLQRFKLTPRAPHFSEASYWEQTYQRALHPFEWAGIGLAELAEYGYDNVDGSRCYAQLATDVPMGEPALLLGTGTSLLPEEMARAGWCHLTNVDFASSVARPRAAAALESGIGGAWVQADARRLDDVFQPRSFAAALDKGLLDGIYLGGSGRNDAMSAVARATAGVLRPGGRLVTLSFSAPRFFLPPLEAAVSWQSVEARRLQDVWLYRLVTRGAPRPRPRRAGVDTSDH